MLVILKLRRLRQRNHLKFEASLDYMRPCSKKKKPRGQPELLHKETLFHRKGGGGNDDYEQKTQQNPKTFTSSSIQHSLESLTNKMYDFILFYVLLNSNVL